MNDSIFTSDTYLTYLKLRIQKEGGFRGYRTQLAKAAGCQPAYLSQVLAKKVHLTLEQAAGLCDFWGFTEVEADYFLTLTECTRAGNQSLRQKLERRLAKLRKQSGKDPKNKSDDDETIYMNPLQAIQYYASWEPSAVHMLVGLYGNNTASQIAQRLNLPVETVQSILLSLEQAEIVTKDGAHYSIKNKFIHVPDDNVFSALHHKNWREKSHSFFNQGLRGNNFHYTAIASLNKKTFDDIRNLLENTKVQSEDMIKNSPEKTIACMNVDWFEI